MTQLFMRRPTLDGLPSLPDLPPGYAVRSYQEGDLEALAAVLRRAFDDETWTPDRVRGALVDASDVVRVLVVDFNGAPVATASARLTLEHSGSGYVHWVAVDPAHQGRGLGYAVSLAVLHEFALLGCRDAVLETDDPRLAAIRTYLKLGFWPEHRHESHPARWAAVEVGLARNRNA